MYISIYILFVITFESIEIIVVVVILLNPRKPFVHKPYLSLRLFIPLTDEDGGNAN